MRVKHAVGLDGRGSREGGGGAGMIAGEEGKHVEDDGCSCGKIFTRDARISVPDWAPW